MDEQVNLQRVILVYDLPSENVKSYPNDIKSRVRSVRVTCTRLLHNLGVQATESVILVAPSKLKYVDSIITIVNEMYSKLNLLLQPTIVVLPITESQQNTLNVLAQKRIDEQVEEATKRVSVLLKNIENINDEKTKKKIKKSTLELRRAYITLKQFCEELGLNTKKIDYLIENIDNALERMQ